jgi:hypothetical protein
MRWRFALGDILGRRETGRLPLPASHVGLVRAPGLIERES